VDRLDGAIREAYVRFNAGTADIVSADKIATTPAILKNFVRLLRQVAPKGMTIDSETVGWRLLTLRKRGADKSGLPRISRDYFGRQARAG